MRQPFKQAIRNHMEAEHLSADQLSELRRLLEKRDEPHRPRRKWMAMIAASFFIGIAIPPIWHMSRDTSDLVLRVAEEIALNHLKQKPLDVAGERIAALRPAFSELGFALRDSAHFENTPWRLTGGRYCSVQTVPAAQLRYREADGEPVTVYQAPYQPDLHGPLPKLDRGDAPVRFLVRGVEVEIWIEGGLLLATAKNAVP